MSAVSLPEPLRACVPDTFAHHTVTVRIPEIGRRILRENRVAPRIEARLRTLLEEIPQGPIRQMEDLWAPDSKDWDEYVRPHLGEDWLSVPWFFAETYFYRRVAEAVRFFRKNGTRGNDPFALQKRLGLETTREEIASVAALSLQQARAGWHADSFAALLHLDLWGNQADLSMWPAGEDQRPRHEDAESAAAHLLADDAPRAATLVDRAVRSGRPVQIDIVVDNAGFELIGDLVLAHYVLATVPQARVTLHLKLHPTFVSDAMTVDVRSTINFLRSAKDRASVELGTHLLKGMVEKRLILDDHAFWTSPLAGWEMPADLKERLESSALVVSKGDANYRRFLGDRHWPHTTPFGEAAGYLPCPLLALRTLKSELIVGLPPGRSEDLAREDDAWLVNGRRGVIQLAA